MGFFSFLKGVGDVFKEKLSIGDGVSASKAEVGAALLNYVKGKMGLGTEVDAESAGILGSSSAEVSKAAFEYADGEIGKQKLKEEVKKVLTVSAVALVGKLIDAAPKAIHAVAEKIEEKRPAVAGALHLVGDVVKVTKPLIKGFAKKVIGEVAKKVADKAIDLAGKAGSRIKRWLFG